MRRERFENKYIFRGKYGRRSVVYKGREMKKLLKNRQVTRIAFIMYLRD